MKPYRGNAIAAGVLFIVCTAVSILSMTPLGSTLDGADYLSRLAASDGRAVLTAILEFIWAATGAGVAVALYPVLAKRNRALAVGSVVGRAVEGVFVLVGTLALLVLLSLGEESLGTAGAASYGVIGDSLLAARDWTHGFVALLPWLVGALLYYYVFYRWRIVPRWLSIWGLGAGVLCLVATIYSAFTQDFGFTTLNTALNMPIAAQEMVLAVWLIVKGFDLRNVSGGTDVASVVS